MRAIKYAIGVINKKVIKLAAKFSALISSLIFSWTSAVKSSPSLNRVLAKVEIILGGIKKLIKIITKIISESKFAPFLNKVLTLSNKLFALFKKFSGSIHPGTCHRDYPAAG